VATEIDDNPLHRFRLSDGEPGRRDSLTTVDNHRGSTIFRDEVASP
jgi:hypothetical protein